MGLFLVSYLATPLVLLAASAGAGLAVRHLARGAVAPVLVLPLGFVTLLAVGTFLTGFDWNVTAHANWVAIVALGAGGLIWRRHDVRPLLGDLRAWRWPALAGLGAFLAILSPAFLTGQATWTGYARIVDLALQFEWASWLTTHGRELPFPRPSSFLVVMSKTAVTGYPGAGNAVLGSVGQILGVSSAWTYQPFMAFAAAMLALGVYGLLARIVPSRALRALAGFIAAQASTLYGYALVGGIKELTTAAALVFCAAVISSVRPREDGIFGLLPLAIGVAALMGTFSITVGPWLAVLVVLAVLATVLVRRRETRLPRVDWQALGPWVGAGLVAIVLAAPMIYWATQLAKVAVQAQGPGATALIDLGNLGAPVPARAALGVWISGDYRVPINGDTTATLLGELLGLALVVIGLVWAARRRERGLLFLGLGGIVAMLYFTQRTGPWIQLKAITVTGPIALSLAFAGAAAIAAVRRFGRLPAVASWAAALALSAAVLAGNALAWHDISLAPTDRMRDLEHLGHAYAGQGPTLFPAHEEYAEYFLRAADGSAYVNPAFEGSGFVGFRADVLALAPQPSYVFDLDAMDVQGIERYPLLMLPRGPLWSRPPANFELVQRTRFHDVYKRRERVTVLQHVPVPGTGPAGVAAECKALVRKARRAGPDARVAWADVGQVAVASLGTGQLSSREWVRQGDALRMYGPGSVQTAVVVPEAGRYRVWLQGPNQRPLHVTVDRRPAGTLGRAWAYGQNWSMLDTMTLPAGQVGVHLARGSGRPLPGDGAGGQPIGPLVLERVDAHRGGTVHTAPASQARRVCADAGRYDWVELIRP
jgi:hypothetical protein